MISLPRRKENDPLVRKQASFEPATRRCFFVVFFFILFFPFFLGGYSFRCLPEIDLNEARRAIRFGRASGEQAQSGRAPTDPFAKEKENGPITHRMRSESK